MLYTDGKLRHREVKEPKYTVVLQEWIQMPVVRIHHSLII